MKALSPRAKILIYALLSVVVFISRSFEILLPLLAGVVICSIMTPLSRLKQGLFPIIIFLLFTFTGNLLFQKGEGYAELFGLPITYQGLHRGALLTVRLLVLILAAKILTATTEPEDLVRGIRDAIGPIGKVGFVNELIRTMILTLRLLPVIYHEGRDLLRDIRNSEARGLSQKIRLAVSLLTELFERSLNEAKKMTNAEKDSER